MCSTCSALNPAQEICKIRDCVCLFFGCRDKKNIRYLVKLLLSLKMANYLYDEKQLNFYIDVKIRLPV